MSPIEGSVAMCSVKSSSNQNGFVDARRIVQGK
jgi:hypothetical protein